MSTSVTDRLRELIKPIDHPPVRTFKVAGVTTEGGNTWFGKVVPEVDFRVLEAQSARLAPLLEAMVKCVEAASWMHSQQASTIFIDEPGHVEHFFKAISAALADLEQVLTKMEGK